MAIITASCTVLGVETRSFKAGIAGLVDAVSGGEERGDLRYINLDSASKRGFVVVAGVESVGMGCVDNNVRFNGWMERGYHNLMKLLELEGSQMSLPMCHATYP